MHSYVRMCMDFPVTLTCGVPLGILVGFVESKRNVEENSVNEVCIEVCEGVLKREAVVNVEAQSGTALCKCLSVLAMHVQCLG